MKIAELFARLGVKADTPKLKGFSAAMDSAKTLVVTTTGDIMRFVGELRKMTDEMFDAAVAFKQFEAETGASAQELQKWQAVAEQTNNSADSVAQAIKAITSNQEKIKLGQGDISGYQLLGIDPRQDPFKILEDLRTKTAGLNQAMKKNMLAQMGVGADLIQVLELSNKKFQELSGNAFVIPGSAIDSMNDAKSSMNLLGNAVKWLKGMIAAELAPGIVDLNKKIATWIKNNKDGIVKTMKAVFEWTSKVAKAIMNAGMMINNIIVNTIGWENAVKGLIGILVLLNAHIIASPIGLLIAGLLLLIAILDDLYVYSQGKGKSLFGVLMSTFPELEEALGKFGQGFKDSVNLIKNLFRGDEAGIEEFKEKLGGLGSLIVTVFSTLKATGEFVINQMKKVFGPWKDLIESFVDFETTFGSPAGITDLLKKMAGAWWEGYKATSPFLGFLRDKGERATSASTYNMDIKINTTGTPEETARQIEEAMARIAAYSEAQAGRDE